MLDPVVYTPETFEPKLCACAIPGPGSGICACSIIGGGTGRSES